MHTGLHIKYLLYLSDFSQTKIFSTDFGKILTFHESPYSGSWVVPWGRTDGQT